MTLLTTQLYKSTILTHQWSSPELIRLLTARGIDLDEAISIVRSMTAYTNHTILAEALEKWPLEFLQEVVPHLVPIIEELDRRVKAEVKDPAVQIIDESGRVTHGSHWISTTDTVLTG